MSVVRTTRQSAFTIVELLIVIVVIGILAAITVVAYNGVQSRARAASASAALNQAAKKLSIYQTTSGTFPATGGLSLAGVTNTIGGVSYEYTANISVNPQTYCITATHGNVSYYLNNTTNLQATSGGCAGHGQGGLAAITNIVKNPKGIGGSSGWFVPLNSAYVSSVSNVSWGVRSDWTRFTWNGAGYTTTRLLVDLSNLVNGTTYTASVLFGNPNAVTITCSMDFNDVAATTVTLQPGETRRAYVTGTLATYSDIYRFIDINPSTVNNGVLVTEAMLTAGSDQNNYADGSSLNWVWNGAANASTSTGPPL